MNHNMQRSETPILLTTNQVAQILGVHTQTIRRYIKQGDLAAIRISARDFRVELQDLRGFLERRRTPLSLPDGRFAQSS